MHATWQKCGIILVWMALFMGCSTKPDAQKPDIGDAVEIQLEKGQSESLLGFYLGGYVQNGDSLSSVLIQSGANWYLKRPLNPTETPELQALYDAAGADQMLNWEEFEPMVRSAYYTVRNAPRSLDSLRQTYGEWGGPDWFVYETAGQMTAFRRRLSIRRADLLRSLEQLTSLKDPIIYEKGAAIFGEHLDAGKVVETTVMIKRSDTYWDYFAYGADGRLVGSIAKREDPLLVPTQCIGCHYGNRAFEPERSFPKDAKPGPTGERAVYVPDAWKNADLAKTLNEHAKRSDHILGLYATLYLSDVLMRSKSAEASDRELNLIAKLVIE